jgi:hypothetical protein
MTSIIDEPSALKQMRVWALQHRTTAIELDIAKRRLFPPGKPVHVDAPRYHGYGVATLTEGKADELAVRLENGNVWNYPIESCRPAKWHEVDKATKRAHLRLLLDRVMLALRHQRAESISQIVADGKQELRALTS